MQEDKKYIAHITEDLREQTLKEHLECVAKSASDFSCDLVKDITFLAGLLHDLGKYSDAFQKRIRGSKIQVEHSLAGALYAKENITHPLMSLMLQYVIMGHHSGLPDGGTDVNKEDDPTLNGRLSRTPQDYSAFKTEISPKNIGESKMDNLLYELWDQGKEVDAVEVFAFLTRYVFSCLCDADFLDTEMVFNPETERGFSDDFELALKLLDAKINTFLPNTPVKKARAELFVQAKENAEFAEQINILNMPTGSGKTLTSLRIALDIAKREGKRRIIYVIPYTSIIEQTAAEFADIFKENLTILQHHSNFDFEAKKAKEKDGDPTNQKLKKAAENWDCSLVITTNVQFFSSLYNYKGSKLRKMHNTANSVLVFDEIHMLPIECLQPCIRAIGYITQYLDSKAIFLSATMPDYDGLFQRYIPECKVKNLITDKTYFKSFKNTEIHYLGEISSEALISKASEAQSALIVTGTKKSARELFKLAGGKKYHLSTYMKPKHRSEVICLIKKDLKAKRKITVISTSLIEAGVDLDFEVVFRELSGVDSLLQSAGRCNREGRNAVGNVYIYKTGDKRTGEIEMRSSITLNLIKKYKDIADNRCVAEYFSRLYGFNYDSIEQNSIAGSPDSLTPLDNLPFREYANNFKLIENDTVGVVINRCEDCAQLLESLRFGKLRAVRSLQKYTVSVSFFEFEDALKRGFVHEHEGVYVLSDNKLYNEDYGLCFNENYDEDYICV